MVATLRHEMLAHCRRNQLIKGGVSPADQQIYDDMLADLHTLLLDDSTLTAVEIAFPERDLGNLDQGHREIREQRGLITELTGRIRDIDEGNHPTDVFEGLSAESTMREPRTLQLKADKRALAQKLTATRESARFHDRRLGDLVVQRVNQPLCDPAEAP